MKAHTMSKWVDYINRDDYSTGDLIEAITKRLKTETEKPIIIALREKRSEYIEECEKYPYTLIKELIDYIYSKDQSIDKIERIYISQQSLVANRSDIEYYIRHYFIYNRNSSIDTYNNGRYDIDYKLFSMSNLSSKTKLTKILKTYAVSNEAKEKFNIEE